MKGILQGNINIADRLHDSDDAVIRWFVMRDLTRANAKLPAYLMLKDMGVECFTPMVWKLVMSGSKREKRRVPFMHDLLFVHGRRLEIDPLVERVSTFQYRFLKQRRPMTVRDADMERFKHAVESSESPIYYKPEEITSGMLRREIRIIGGNLDGYTGHLVTVRGSKVKRLLVELPSLLAATVEVEPEYIQLL